MQPNPIAHSRYVPISSPHARPNRALILGRTEKGLEDTATSTLSDNNRNPCPRNAQQIPNHAITAMTSTGSFPTFSNHSSSSHTGPFPYSHLHVVTTTITSSCSSSCTKAVRLRRDKIKHHQDAALLPGLLSRAPREKTRESALDMRAQTHIPLMLLWGLVCLLLWWWLLWGRTKKLLLTLLEPLPPRC
ncbi:hypothetical protein B0J18DRAFT_431016 [Chaetomium sp. MPI-SDFR-AT-0129]|nr:hypothetical protein B0J18DRAFT_431016 [Chaetomium sp. MPI-SDFR-AT-0129]